MPQLHKRIVIAAGGVFLVLCIVLERYWASARKAALQERTLTEQARGGDAKALADLAGLNKKKAVPGFDETKQQCQRAQNVQEILSFTNDLKNVEVSERILACARANPDKSLQELLPIRIKALLDSIANDAPDKAQALEDLYVLSVPAAYACTNALEPWVEKLRTGDNTAANLLRQLKEKGIPIPKYDEAHTAYRAVAKARKKGT